MPELLSAIRDRRARRALDSRPVSRDVLEALGGAFRLAPSQGNNQPGRLLFAIDDVVRGAVFESLTGGNKNWAGAAPVLAAIAANPAHDLPFTGPDGIERDYWQFDTGLAAATLMVQATALGLIAHPMAGFNELEVRHAFAAPEHIRVLAVVAIGYPGDVAALPEDLQVREATPRRRLPVASTVAFDRWSDANDLSFAEFRKASP